MVNERDRKIKKGKKGESEGRNIERCKARKNESERKREIQEGERERERQDYKMKLHQEEKKTMLR